MKSPGVDLTLLHDEKDSTEVSSRKPKRSSFINKKWSIFDKSEKTKSKDIPSTKTVDKPIISNSSSPRDIVNPIKRQSSEETIEHATPGVNESHSIPSRPNSLNISLVEGSVDSNLSETTWDVFRNFKKMSVGSEDDISDTCSVPSIVEDQKREEFEENLREETLLRKRRNSLTLERGQIVLKLDTLKDINNNNNNVKKSSHKQSTISMPEKTTDLTTLGMHKEKIFNLERRVEDIDSQIEIIDKHIDLRFEPHKQKKRLLGSRKSTGQQLRSRLKLTTNKKQLENINSMSVESLSSSASHGSSLGHDSPSAFTTNKTFDSTIKNRKIAEKISDCSDINATSTSHDKSRYSGIEELLITTQKLESSNNAKLNQPLSTSDKWRSKSLGSVDLIKSRSKKKEVRIGSSSTLDSTDIIEVCARSTKDIHSIHFSMT